MKPDRQPSDRLLSLDTLRGFDMFWIIGGDEFFRTLATVTGWGWAGVVAGQLEHVPWQGFHFYDLIFPLFMFISGVAMPFSLLARAEGGGSKDRIYGKLLRRAGLLVLLGIIYNGILRLNFAEARYASVLGQIGLAYLFAALIMLNVKSAKGRIAALIVVLGGYAAVQLFVPVPGIGAGVLTPEGVINGYVDRALLPGTLYGKVFDPEGLLCIVSATGITLLGGLAGAFLRSGRGTGLRKGAVLFGTGAGLFIVGTALKIWYPVIKSAWTSTFNIYAGGICFMLLAVFYIVIDVARARRWTFFFRVIGLNSITIYLATKLIAFGHPSRFLFGGLGRLAGSAEPLVLIAGVIAVEWLGLYFLDRHKVYLRV
jgi:predicted acyltransferase